MAKVKPYAENGVSFSKWPISVGDKVEVLYSGILATSGADMIYLHAGYNEKWDEMVFVPLTQEDNLFKTSLKVNKSGNLNLTFKDSANNWDNNNGENYSFAVDKNASESEEPKSTVKKETTETKPTSAKKSTEEASRAKAEVAATKKTKVAEPEKVSETKKATTKPRTTAKK